MSRAFASLQILSVLVFVAHRIFYGRSFTDLRVSHLRVAALEVAPSLKGHR
jgi:hypothetical protein